MVVCTSEPDVAVTVIVDVPAGVPFMLLHPPMPIASSSATFPNITVVSRRLRPVLPNAMNASRIALSAKLHSANCGGVHGFGLLDGGKPLCIVVATENIVVATLAPGVTDGGVNAGVVAAGSPEAEKVTAFGKPPAPGVIVIVKFAVCPDVTVTAAPGPVSAKSMPVPDRDAVCVVGEASSVNVTVAGPRAPTTGGVNVKLRSQLAPAATVAPFVQVVPVAATAKSAALVPLIATLVICSGEPPGLVRVILDGLLVVATP